MSVNMFIFLFLVLFCGAVALLLRKQALEQMKLAEKVRAGELEPEDITEEMISANLDTAVLDYPDPDLLIRTSGEQRLSNFMLWQNAYAEMYFPELLWPDFRKDDLVKAIEVYNGRDRRYGGRNEA